MLDVTVGMWFHLTKNHLRRLRKTYIIDMIEGTEIWVTVENANNGRVSLVENQIVVRLHDRLGMARIANDIFRVFSKFSAFFVRPKVCFVKWAANFLPVLITKTDPCCHPRISNGTH